MPKSLKYVFLAIVPFGIAHAQSLDIGTVTKAAAVTRDTCLSGRQYDLKVNGDGSLSLIKLETGVKGEVRITQNSGTGGALNYTDEGQRVKADAAILNCITATLPVILRSLGARLAESTPDLSKPNPTTQQTTYGLGSPAISGVGGNVTVQSGSK
ncbi:MAG TPA: hypothetical protein VGG11_14575 [Xanthobacteraceae bacterium]|jgi:hypothetical protein